MHLESRPYLLSEIREVYHYWESRYGMFIFSVISQITINYFRRESIVLNSASKGKKQQHEMYGKLHITSVLVYLTVNRTTIF